MASPPDDLRHRGRLVVGPSRTALVVCQSLLGLTLALVWLAFLVPDNAVHSLPVWMVAVGLAAGSAVFFWCFHGRDQLRETDEGLLACRRGVWRGVPWSDMEGLAWARGHPGGPVVSTRRPRTRWDDACAYLCRPVLAPWENEPACEALRRAAEQHGVPFRSAAEIELISLPRAIFENDAKDLDHYRVG